jgi:hypothetical protein
MCCGVHHGGQRTPSPSVDGTIGTASAIAAGQNSTLAIRGLCPDILADPGCTLVDADDDGTNDGADNCRFYSTPNQNDTDADGRGDACECTDQNGDGRNTVSDLVEINRAIFTPALVTPLCDGDNNGSCNVSDIIAANVEIFSPGNTSTCERQPVPGP